MKKFGLIGTSLKHSYSAAYFTKKFQELGLNDHYYQPFELSSIDELPSLIELNPELKGLNVTIPFKQQVIPFLDNADEIVRQTSACNCIKIEEGKLYGSNTDAPGFMSALQAVKKKDQKTALILGTGGASKAVAFAFDILGIRYQFVSRQQSPNLISYEDLNKSIIEDHLIIVNSTPLGTFPEIEKCPQIPYEYITPRHLLFDLIYNPEKTEFLKRGEERGAEIENGYSMWLGQAEASWKIWNS